MVLRCLFQTDHRRQWQNLFQTDIGASGKGSAVRDDAALRYTDCVAVTVDDPGTSVFMPQVCPGGFSCVGRSGKQNALLIVFHEGRVEYNATVLSPQMPDSQAIQYSFATNAHQEGRSLQLYAVLSSSVFYADIAMFQPRCTLTIYRTVTSPAS